MVVNAATPSVAVETGYVDVNGVHMYYERHGSGGHPLLLLHGGFGTIDLMFGQAMLPALAASREVIAVEFQGHGHTADIDRPLRHHLLASDTIGLLEAIGVENVDVFGYSLGGGTALQMAIQRPGLIRKLIVGSAVARHDGWVPELQGNTALQQEGAAEMLAATPLYEFYTRVAPRPEDWPKLVARVAEGMATQTFDWTADIAKISSPTLLIFGDADSVQWSHILEFVDLLGGFAVGDLGQTTKVQLAVLPGTSHSTLLMRPDLIVPMMTTFLDAPMPENG